MRDMRTDLAVEAHRLWQESAGETTRLAGVKAREGRAAGFPVERVDILDREGARALGKSVGAYLTVDLTGLWRREADGFSRAVSAVAELLGPLLPPEGPVLVAGLGNSSMTPDALGPRTAEHILVTRHLGRELPMLRPVAALAAGVLGDTGLEAAEWVRGAAERVKPAAVIVVDALAAREVRRLCAAVQISDAGLVPGSGVGNCRSALDRETLGVPVIALGVPTVVEAATLVRDLLGTEDGPAPLADRGRSLFVTPDSVDAKIRDLARVLGYGIDLALQPGLALEDLTALLE